MTPRPGFPAQPAARRGPVALAYYRADWALQDLGAFAAQVLAPGDEATRRDAARLFRGLFAPGAIVAKALGSAVPPA